MGMNNVVPFHILEDEQMQSWLNREDYINWLHEKAHKTKNSYYTRRLKVMEQVEENKYNDN